MLKSMTGFAKFETELAEGKLYGEARSLNNRYLEVNVKLPKSDYITEQRLRELVKRQVKRGKVDISFKWERSAEQPSMPKINDTAIKQYLHVNDVLKNEYGLKGDLTVENILSFRDIITYEENNCLTEEMLIPTCEGLLGKLNEEKMIEGTYIEKDILSRLDTISRLVEEIEGIWPGSINHHEKKLREKIQEIIKTATVDETRILQEMAVYMERLDITEEIVRLKGHVDHFRSSIVPHEPVGRKLDFIIQEMVRETNTIGSKSNDLPISERVILIKVEIEKIREQVQNVE